MTQENSVSLSGLVAVVTGGARGIGRAIVNTLSRRKATVVFTGRDEQLLRQFASELNERGHRAEGVLCDLTDLASVDALGNHLRETYGRVDILVNNAGVGGPSGPLHELAPEQWEAIFHTNLRGTFYMMRAIVPLMIAGGGGHIINISSLAGKNPLPGGAAYSASKWGLNGLTYSVAEELRSHNIRVSLVCPGSVNTSFNPRRQNKNTERMLQPEDVAHVVESLVTQEPRSFMSEVLLRPTIKP